MKITTDNQVDILIAQHQVVVKAYKKYNDYVNRNTKSTEDHHVKFANNVTIRNAYRTLERALRIQLQCYNVIYDGKGKYNIPITYKDKKNEEKENSSDND